jgi:predicted DNA-binding transcriptional regulator AlpA
MTNPSTTRELSNQPAAPIELLDRPAVLKFFGGSRPLHASTLYRGIGDCTYPKPINVGSGSSSGAVRWLRSECEAALERMIAARHEPKPPERRGRKRRQRIT